MSREDLHLLLEKYLNNQCSAEEKLLIERLYGMLDKEDLEEVYPNELSDLEQKLWDNINQQSLITADQPGQRYHKLFWYAAAVISTFCLLTGYLFFADARDPRYVAFQTNSNLVERKNSSTALLNIKLEDGSIVVLQPKSSLVYPEHFKINQREVLLKGEGYFLISKNPKRPFFVYNKNVITRVVGTSFTVKTSENTGQTEVMVRTGKVVVVPNEDKHLNLRQLFRKNDKAVLSPNQKTIYSPDQGNFETSLVPEPIPLPNRPAAAKKIDLFEDTPLPEVVAELKQTYGIDIIVQDQRLNQNTFTGDISGQGLYKKVDLICHSIKAYYEIAGTRIIIKEKKK